MLWCLPALAAVSVYLGWTTVGALLLTAAVVTSYMGWRFERRLGGMTGDGPGATQQVCELAMYVALRAAAGPLRDWKPWPRHHCGCCAMPNR